MDEDFFKIILVEFIEVLIHQIIKLNRIYPDGIFGKRRKYDLALFMSEHPQVNEFIKEITEGINKKLSDPGADIEGVALVISRENKPDKKFRLTFPGFKNMKIDEDTDPEVEADIMESLDINFSSLLLRLAEVMKGLRQAEKEDVERREKREWWVQVEPALSGQTEREGVLLSVFDFNEPFPLQLELETYR